MTRTELMQFHIFSFAWYGDGELIPRVRRLTSYRPCDRWALDFWRLRLRIEWN